jgi:5-methylcytosine-specific restriction protein A
MSRLYSLKRWQHVRLNQLEREPMCRGCRASGVDYPASEVDHITPVEAGGAPFDAANLQSLCKTHHSWKTNTFDKLGRVFTRWPITGSNADGSPRDPYHPWNCA